MAQEADSLRGYWRTLPLQQRLHFLKGLPEAAALVSDSGDGTGSCSSITSSGDLVDVVQDLVLAPVAWCFEVRRPTVFVSFFFSSLRITIIALVLLHVVSLEQEPLVRYLRTAFAGGAVGE